MARKSPEINPAQGTLIDVSQMPDEHAPEIVTAAEYLPPAVPDSPRPIETVYGPEGSYVDVHKRAKGLTAALDAQAQANMRDGFGIASNTREHAGPIYARYQWGTEARKDRAEANGRQFSADAKRRFWHASGYAAMKGAGLGELITNTGIDKRARKDFITFMNRYVTPGSTDSTNARNRMKRRLSKTQKLIEESNQQKAA